MKISEGIERAISCARTWEMPYRLLVKEETRSLLIQPTDHGIPEGYIVIFCTQDDMDATIDTHTVGEDDEQSTNDITDEAAGDTCTTQSGC